MRRFPWKLLFGVSGALALTIGAFALWIHSVAERRWAELRAKIPGLIAEGRGRDPRRPPRAGEPVPGNAWADYKLALDTLTGISQADLGEFVSRGPKADRAKVEGILSKGEGWRVFLAAGARKAEGAQGLDYERGFETGIASLLRTHNLVNLSVSKSRFLFEQGKAGEAVDLLLDAAWFGADVGRNTLLINEMISLGLLGIVLDELRSLVLDPARTDVDWSGLGHALTRLDAVFPDHADSLMNEVTTALCGMSKPEELGLDVGSLAAWRYGFSKRLVIADAMETYLAAMRREAAAQRTSYAEMERVTKEVDAEAAASRNPMARIAVPGLTAHRAGAERRAQLRLLRAAVAARAGGPIPELDDPFGGKLHREGRKVWSRGRDGVDNGGKGGWGPAQGVDLVQELPTK